jgi:hypothetical protein
VPVTWSGKASELARQYLQASLAYAAACRGVYPFTRREGGDDDMAWFRYEALKALTSALPTDRTPTTESLLEILSNGAIMQSITAQQMVIRPSQGSLELFVPRRLLAGGESRES